jgi:hypothetical protein
VKTSNPAYYEVTIEMNQALSPFGNPTSAHHSPNLQVTKNKIKGL